MSIFNSLAGGNQKQGTSQVNAQQAVDQLKADPVGVLGQIGLNVPAGMNDPQQMVQHLLQTGQVPQGRFAQAMQIMGQLAGRR